MSRVTPLGPGVRPAPRPFEARVAEIFTRSYELRHPREPGMPGRVYYAGALVWLTTDEGRAALRRAIEEAAR